MDPRRAYANADYIPDGAQYPAQWAHEAQVFRAQSRADLNRPYGGAAREAFDIFWPEGPPKGLVVFVHGGFWMAFGRETWSHYAAGALARGWAVVMPSYTLAPEARLGQIGQQMARALEVAARDVAGPIRLIGHSAGGQLVARLICGGMGLSEAVLARIDRVIPVSPLADLAPLRETAMNETLAIDGPEVLSESPARLRPRAGVAVKVWVGGAERPAFVWQARLLAEEWGCPWHVAPDRHHFDVLEDLRDPEGPLCKALLD